MIKVNILEAKNRLSELIRSSQEGEEIVIANRGEPVARLVAVRSRSGKARPGSAEAILGWLEAHPLRRHAKRSPRDIAAQIRAERRAWD